MIFEEKYNNIKNTVRDDMDFINQSIKSIFTDKNPLEKNLLDFFSAPSKKLRPLVGLLYTKAFQNEVNDSQKKILIAVELVHNATLIHDDVIDNSETRRNVKTINAIFDDNLAVVAGDFLLSVAMEKIIETNNINVFKLFANALKTACMGEISQYFSKFQLSSIERYIEKSKEKTAVLFNTAVLGSIYASDKSFDIEKALEFSENFGIAFQIRDDLLNISKSETLKPTLNDIEEGIYTAPVLFAFEKEAIEQPSNIFEKIKATDAIEKTKALMDNYFNKASTALECLPNNIYKQSLLDLIQILRTNI